MADAVTREEALELMARMVRIRKFEELAARLRAKGLIPGFLHPYIGQEAVAVGVCAALGDGDVLTSAHRGHGHILGRGADPAKMYAELFARVTGYNRGKGGSLHMIDTELGFLGANGIVAGGIPLATGAALQLKRAGDGYVAVTFFGDGASNEGAFHESMNLAALWKLPVLFICENNLYGEFTRQDKHQLVTDVADRAASYVMPGVVVDGNDVLAVQQVTAEAVELARTGGGPTLIEAKTYRHRGHFEGDMARYRPKDEVAHWMGRDPIDLFAAVLTDRWGVSADEIDNLKTEVAEELKRAAAWAEEQPFPEPSDALTDIYVNDYEGAMLR
ncbi:pyruvate dehydrogenase E1 component subunit alpha [Gordonia spumicola]|uniref:Pyruvate dehydrogenase E1 component subunit alpha n=1 Tax=Gordonia spumicola TaxID=589161 RepID=A0A7I9V333_9ACTN|nr:thiamine pyrophosphate-dependent dehydrogenase E1 component subunit alpha [Gordonia spumicola]GED99818.1 pyruvate dehydrogenase E1 component subunit alpha [Gordonia spumicola]